MQNNTINNNKIIIYKNVIINNQYKERKKRKKIKNSIQNTHNAININSLQKSQSKLVSSNSPEQSSKQVKNINKNSTELLIFNKTIKLKKNKKIYNYNDIELNNLTYEKAILYDKRSYCQYYCSLLKLKHSILFTFISKIDYNLFIIKLSLFIFTFSLYFTLNTLFFEDKTIHKIYKTQGKNHIIYSILNIIYTTLISSFIQLIIKALALSNNSIMELKDYKTRNKMMKESIKLFKKLNIRLYCFFGISFLLLLFFWYFISSFCAIFKNSQLFLIENSLCSFGLTLIYPFGLYLLPGIFRINSLSSENKKCMYSFGRILSFI